MIISQGAFHFNYNFSDNKSYALKIDLTASKKQDRLKTCPAENLKYYQVPNQKSFGFFSLFSFNNCNKAHIILSICYFGNDVSLAGRFGNYLT